MSRGPKWIAPEVKQAALDAVLLADVPIKAAAVEHGIADATLCAWLNRAGYHALAVSPAERSQILAQRRRARAVAGLVKQSAAA